MKFNILITEIIEEAEFDSFCFDLYSLIEEGYVSSGFDTLEKLERNFKQGVLSIKRLLKLAPPKEDQAYNSEAQRARRAKTIIELTIQHAVELGRLDKAERRKKEALEHEMNSIVDMSNGKKVEMSDETVKEMVNDITAKMIGKEAFAKIKPVLDTSIEKSPPVEIYKFLKNTKGSMTDKLAMLYIYYIGSLDLESVGATSNSRVSHPVAHGIKITT